MCWHAGKVKSSSHSGNKTCITASAFCDFNRDTSPPGRAVSFHQLPESSGGRPGCVLWQKGTEGECLVLNSVKFSYQGTESHEDVSCIRFCLSLHWCSKLIFTVLPGGKDHDFPSILLSWLLVTGGSDLEKKSLFFLIKIRTSTYTSILESICLQESRRPLVFQVEIQTKTR